MANKIIIKRSSVTGNVPSAGALDVGELAVNLADQKLFTKNASGTVIELGGGLGDVQGPASSTDNALARFDGTTGKLIQNGTVTQDDNGSLGSVNAISFDTTPTSAPATQGTMAWDNGNSSPSIVLNSDVSLQLGQEQLALVYNGTGSTIPNGSVVAVTGAQGQRPSVVLADADSEPLSASTLGIATQDIANGAEGFVTTFGFVRGVNTSGFTAGAPIYLSQTAGAFTATRPSAPAHTVILGWVIFVNASAGELFVNINNGWELDELHNVLITSPTSGNTLIYDASVGVWKNANLTDGTGISITEGAGSITVANTGVLGVTATSPVASSGGQNPVISMPAATTSVNGYLTSTDWNTFNGKQATLVSGTNIKTVNGTTLLGSGNLAVGTVTSVGATVPTGLTVSGSPITGSGTLAITYTAGYSIPTTASQTNWDTAYSDRLKWDGGSTGLVAATGRTSLGATTIGGNLFTLTNPSAVTFPRFNADNTVSALDAATFRSAIGAGTGSGTVTGVTATSPVASSGGTAPVISLASGYGDTQNPYASKTANFVLAAPNGTAGAPTFRAIVAADIPTLNQNTTGTASNVTGTVAIANGGTGATTRQNAMDALAGAVTSGQYLRGNGTDVVMSAIQAGDVPTLNQNTTGSAATLTTGRTIAITGDLTYTSPSFNGSANVTAAGTLATVNSNVGTYGSSTAIPVVTVNAKGLVTAVSTATVAGGQYFGSAAVKAIAYNANSISENVTVTAGNNGLSAGPITVNTGFTVTVETGANWVIV